MKPHMTAFNHSRISLRSFLQSRTRPKHKVKRDSAFHYMAHKLISPFFASLKKIICIIRPIIFPGPDWKKSNTHQEQK